MAPVLKSDSFPSTTSFQSVTGLHFLYRPRFRIVGRFNATEYATQKLPHGRNCELSLPISRVEHSTMKTQSVQSIGKLTFTPPLTLGINSGCLPPCSNGSPTSWCTDSSVPTHSVPLQIFPFVLAGLNLPGHGLSSTSIPTLPSIRVTLPTPGTGTTPSTPPSPKIVRLEESPVLFDISSP